MAGFVPPVTVEELRQSRTYEEFEAWVDCIIKTIPDSNEAREWIRLDDRLGKRLREEVFPFRVFARSIFVGKDISISFPADNGSCDVLVKLREGSEHRRIRIEIVNALDGRDEKLRMEHLTREGTVTVYGDIRKVKLGPGKRNYLIEQTPAMARREDIVQKSKQLVAAAVDRKIRNEYPAGTWLIVAFDPIPLPRPEDYELMAEIACERARNSGFECVYLVGDSASGFCRQVK
ncbi:MAG: hypothetical protein ACRED7_07750 [Stellaceae bacterium]